MVQGHRLVHHDLYKEEKYSRVTQSIDYRQKMSSFLSIGPSYECTCMIFEKRIDRCSIAVVNCKLLIENQQFTIYKTLLKWLERLGGNRPKIHKRLQGKPGVKRNCSCDVTLMRITPGIKHDKQSEKQKHCSRLGEVYFFNPKFGSLTPKTWQSRLIPDPMTYDPKFWGCATLFNATSQVRYGR